MAEAPTRFSDEEYARRAAAVATIMDSAGCGAVVVFGSSTQNGTGQADVYYLSQHLGKQENVLVVVAGHDPVLLVQSFNHVPNARRQSVIADTRYGGPKNEMGSTVVSLLRERGFSSGQLGLVGPVPYQMVSALTRELPAATPTDLTGALRKLRLIKGAEELTWLRKGAALTDAALQSMHDGMRAGLPEHELAGLLADGYRSDGGDDVLHYISSTPQDAPDRCVPSQKLSDRQLATGDVVAIELSVGFHAYAGQALRTFIIDAEPNALFADLHAVAQEAYDRMLDALRPGASSLDVLAGARVIDEAGYAIVDGLLHGYGVGILPPSLPGEHHVTDLTRPAATGGQPRQFVFEEGMTVVIQPNVVTQDGRAGVQVGNMVVVTDSGAESLHTYPMGFLRA